MVSPRECMGRGAKRGAEASAGGRSSVWPCKHIQIYAIQHKYAYYIALEQLIIPAFEVVTFSTRGGTSGNFDIWVRSRGLIASGGYIELANSRVG